MERIKNKRSNLFILLGAILLAVIIFGVRLFDHIKMTKDQLNPNSPKAPIESKNSTDVNRKILGKKMPGIKAMTMDGIKISVDFMDNPQKEVILFMPDPEQCNKCLKKIYEGISNLSAQLGDQIKIYIFFPKNIPASEERSELKVTNATILGGVVENNGDFQDYRTLLVLTDKATIRLINDLPNNSGFWYDTVEAVKSFVQTGNIPSGFFPPEASYSSKKAFFYH